MNLAGEAELVSHLCTDRARGAVGNRTMSPVRESLIISARLADALMPIKHQHPSHGRLLATWTRHPGRGIHPYLEQCILFLSIKREPKITPHEARLKLYSNSRR